MVEPHIPAFADFAYWKGKRVLEIGCGIGTDANLAHPGPALKGCSAKASKLHRFLLVANPSYKALRVKTAQA